MAIVPTPHTHDTRRLANPPLDHPTSIDIDACRDLQPFTLPIVQTTIDLPDICITGKANACTQDFSGTLSIGASANRPETVVPIEYGDGTDATTSDEACIYVGNAPFQCKICNRVDSLVAHSEGVRVCIEASVRECAFVPSMAPIQLSSVCPTIGSGVTARCESVATACRCIEYAECGWCGASSSCMRLVEPVDIYDVSDDGVGASAVCPCPGPLISAATSILGKLPPELGCPALERVISGAESLPVAIPATAASSSAALAALGWVIWSLALVGGFAALLVACRRDDTQHRGAGPMITSTAPLELAGSLNPVPVARKSAPYAALPPHLHFIVESELARVGQSSALLWAAQPALLPRVLPAVACWLTCMLVACVVCAAALAKDGGGTLALLASVSVLLALMLARHVLRVRSTVYLLTSRGAMHIVGSSTSREVGFELMVSAPLVRQSRAARACAACGGPRVADLSCGGDLRFACIRTAHSLERLIVERVNELRDSPTAPVAAADIVQGWPGESVVVNQGALERARAHNASSLGGGGLALGSVELKVDAE